MLHLPELDSLRLPRKGGDYRGGYYGTRPIENFPPVFFETLDKCFGFCDLTAGSGQTPYELLRMGRLVKVNDRNFYAYVLMKAHMDFFGYLPNVTQYTWLQGMYTILGKVKPKKGYLSTWQQNYPRSIFNQDLTRYIDGLCITAQSAPIILAAVGKTLATKFTFRGAELACKMSNGIRSDSITPEALAVMVIRALNRMRLTALTNLDNLENFHFEEVTQVEITNYDALTAARKFDLTNFLAYADPAWPWADGIGPGNQTPYTWLTNVIGGTLSQRPPSEVTFWTRSTPKETILSEVKGWIDAAFTSGAKVFWLSMQDTNYPNIQDIVATLKPQETIYQAQRSSVTGDQFGIAWAVFNKKGKSK